MTHLTIQNPAVTFPADSRPGVAERRPAAPPARSPLRVAYLTTEYPKVSHTFIRREIAELEKRGHHVERLSIRPPGGALVDPADRAEAEKTLFCLRKSKVKLLGHAAAWAVRRPLRFLAAVGAAGRFYRASDRGLVRHVAYLAEAAYLADHLRTRGISHVHVHFGTNAATVAVLMKAIAGITYSMTVHGPGEFDAPVGLGLAAKVAGSEFTAAISHYGKAQLQRWVHPEHWSRIHIVRCTVNADFLAPPPPYDPTSMTLVCIGRLTPQKGQLLLVDAFARLTAQGRPGRLVFAGDGELRPQIEERIRRHGLGDRVTVTGWLSERQVRDHITQARAVVLPSSAEGLPVVLMESLALGRPVVSTHTAGIPELVKHGQNGWLTPAGDLDSLTDVLGVVMATPGDQLQRMGEVGRELVARQHHPATEAEVIESLFLAARR